jgi:hypothetical protein
MKRSNFKGKFTPKNPLKYNGNVNQIIYRSSWERLFMSYCDRHPSIVSWSSEEIKVPYKFDGKHRTYYPDFWISMIDESETLVEKLIEIKPYYQRSWKINKAKWEQAEQACYQNGMQFLVLTERDLF